MYNLSTIFFLFLKNNYISILNKESFIDFEKTYLFEELLHQIQNYCIFLEDNKDNFVVVDGKTSFKSYALIIACFIINVDFTIFLDLDISEKSRRLEAIKKENIKIFDSEKIKIKLTKKFDVKDFISTLEINAKALSKKSKLLMFSSGSTGVPKIISIDKFKFLESYKFTLKNQSRRILLLLLIDHIGGLNTLLSTFFCFDTLVIPKSKESKDIVSILKKSESQILPGSPTFLNMLLTNSDFNQRFLDKLRVITYGTEKMPNFIIDKIRVNFPKIKLIQTFGTTETGIVQMKISKKHDTIKFAKPEEFKILNNILYLKSNFEATYLNSDNSDTFQDGWFNTGDIVEKNKDGSIKIIGRVKDVINVGGNKVTPQEIENIVGNLNGIEDVLCYPIPNPITNQCVGLKIKANANSDPLKLKKLIKKEFLNFEKFKRPVLIEFVDKILYSQRGKKVRS